MDSKGSHNLSAEVSHRLVWALRVTATSYTRGVVIHRLATGPLESLAACQSLKRRVSPQSALARLPPEILSNIGALLGHSAQEDANEQVKRHTWNCRRHESAEARPTQPEEDGSTSNEDPGRTDSQDESDVHRDKMEDRAKFFLTAAREMNWKRPGDTCEYGPKSDNRAYLKQAFGLDAIAMTSVAHFQRRGKIQHVFICLPWTCVPLCEGVTRTSELFCNRLSSNQQTMKTWIDPSPARTASGTNPRYEARYNRSVCEVDPEYLQLTDEKVRKLNQAVNVLGLEVDLWNPRQSEGFAERPIGNPLSFESRLASEFTILKAENVPRTWHDRGLLPWQTPPTHYVDHRHQVWPIRESQDGRRVVYIPKLISLLEQTLNEWALRPWEK